MRNLLKIFIYLIVSLTSFSVMADDNSSSPSNEQPSQSDTCQVKSDNEYLDLLPGLWRNTKGVYVEEFQSVGLEVRYIFTNDGHVSFAMGPLNNKHMNFYQAKGDFFIENGFVVMNFNYETNPNVGLAGKTFYDRILCVEDNTIQFSELGTFVKV